MSRSRGKSVKGERTIRIFISGDEGFIGSRLRNALEMHGHEVIGYDVVNGYDLRDYGQLKLIFDQYDPHQIYHIGGQAYLKHGEANPYHDIDVNVNGMINILRLMEDTDRQMVYTSTGAVYGLSPLPHKENMNTVPLCNYGLSKLMAEKYMQKWVLTRNIDAKAVRFSSIYGLGRRAGPINIFLSKAIHGEPIEIYGSGSQTRDFVHVDDVIIGMKLVMDRGRKGWVYNLGSGEENSVERVAQIVKKLYPNTKIEYRPAPQSLYDLPRSWFDIEPARGLGWEPKIPLELGIQLTAFEMENDRI